MLGKSFQIIELKTQEQTNPLLEVSAWWRCDRCWHHRPFNQARFIREKDKLISATPSQSDFCIGAWQQIYKSPCLMNCAVTSACCSPIRALHNWRVWGMIYWRWHHYGSDRMIPDSLNETYHGSMSLDVLLLICWLLTVSKSDMRNRMVLVLLYVVSMYGLLDINDEKCFWLNVVNYAFYVRKIILWTLFTM